MKDYLPIVYLWLYRVSILIIPSILYYVVVNYQSMVLQYRLGSLFSSPFFLSAIFQLAFWIGACVVGGRLKNKYSTEIYALTQNVYSSHVLTIRRACERHGHPVRSNKMIRRILRTRRMTLYEYQEKVIPFLATFLTEEERSRISSGKANTKLDEIILLSRG